MTKDEMQEWYDEKMRDLAETEARLRGYLHQLENSTGNDARLFENREILLAMQCFEIAVGHVALFVARRLAAFNEMSEAVGSA